MAQGGEARQPPWPSRLRRVVVLPARDIVFDARGLHVHGSSIARWRQQKTQIAGGGVAGGHGLVKAGSYHAVFDSLSRALSNARHCGF
jgi:hypothetical protein